MTQYRIVRANIEVSSTDLSSPSPMPTLRLTPPMMLDRVIRLLSAHADIYQVCAAVEQSGPITAPDIESAALQAITRFQAQLRAAWTTPDGDVPNLLAADPVYRMLPTGEHVTIGWIMLDDLDGTTQALEFDIQDGADAYRCWVCACATVGEVFPVAGGAVGGTPG